MGLPPQPRTQVRPARRASRAALVLALIAALTTLVAARPAAAEVEHPRQQWLRDSTAGLFLHWGMFTAPRHLDCAQWESDVTDGGWTRKLLHAA
ncbi:hypothetical protein MTP10_11080 [Nonomuraea sp. 3-1Str]|uniref:hypothetical protein n=1 Tax=Nonomuraea sp. 3-1Str TaxID=2929801 RepID=UPI002860BCCB|nr:hypothetical protein [Nonomuraea sp. 3-1Str]MDR8409280.1 hypothetical protein [Nonomuraea sp. 3-1Str]